MILNKNEGNLVGKWIFTNGQMQADETAKRIEWLVSKHLKKLGSTGGGWDVLFIDSSDQRLWELTYPQSDMQGGGPPELTNITKSEASKKYGLDL
jgi:hypothetical protein